MKLKSILLAVIMTGTSFFAAAAQSSSSPNTAAKSRDCSFLMTTLGKDPHAGNLIDSLSDLGESLPAMTDEHDKAWPDSDKPWRFKVLANFQIADVIAAPGHRFLRKPEQIEGLVKYIKENHGGNFAHDKIILNIVTDNDHNITEVDIWNAHHRAMAYMKAGYKTIGDLNPDNIDILVNGRDLEGHTWPHHLSSAGFDIERFTDWSVVPPFGDTRVGTVAVDGGLSNFALGSRNTIRQLYFNTFEHRQPRIGVYFGAFDPVHEGHVAVAKQAIKDFNLDEVVFAPNVHASNKPNISDYHLRVKMLEARFRHEPHLNVYSGDSSVIIDRFGRDPFIERLGQIYGTKQIYQIIGSDSAEKLFREGAISPQGNRRYIISERGDAPLDREIIPADIRDLVSFNTPEGVLDLSSTRIRTEIKNGQTPGANELSPEVLEFIKTNRLYK